MTQSQAVIKQSEELYVELQLPDHARSQYIAFSTLYQYRLAMQPGLC